uniref:Uncharacterized protein n=1 Tax=Rhizophora mucronata TaxID=61149 RepID=A0A2P2PFD3_RHIMU
MKTIPFASTLQRLLAAQLSTLAQTTLLKPDPIWCLD